MEILAQNTLLENLRNAFAFSNIDTNRLKAIIAVKKSELVAFQKQVDNFDFYQLERHINKKLARDIEKRIAILNKYEFGLDNSLDRMKKQFSGDHSFDIENLQELYQEVQIYLPDKLVKDYTELQEFHFKLNEERNIHLKNQIAQRSIELKKVKHDLKRYTSKRRKIMSVLTTGNTFRKFKYYQMELVRQEKEIAKLELKLENIHRIKLLERIILQSFSKQETVTAIAV